MDPMKLIQPATPVPESKIWGLGKHFYAEQGPKAWSESLIPQGITSNCYKEAHKLLERGAAEFGQTFLRRHMMALALKGLGHIAEEDVRAKSDFAHAQ